MELPCEIAARASRMVATCGLDSMSVFLTSRSAAHDEMTYLYHHGISAEAQHAYSQDSVFTQDPFTHAIDAQDRTGRMLRWGEHRLTPAAQAANDYRAFIDRFSIEVVGAWVQQVIPNLFLVIGTHCRKGGHSLQDVGMDHLTREAPALGQMVVGALFEEVVSRTAAKASLISLLTIPGEDSTRRADAGERLTKREREISRLVADGKQNKQIAHIAGISEFTVENHLRSIYSKLHVHSRTGMIRRLSEHACQ